MTASIASTISWIGISGSCFASGTANTSLFSRSCGDARPAYSQANPIAGPSSPRSAATSVMSAYRSRSVGAAMRRIMRRALERRPNGGIAVDGPLGPYHKVKRGAVKLAAELGYVVVPASATARRKRTIKHRWDRMEIPALFTRIGLAIGEPKKIPCNLFSRAKPGMGGLVAGAVGDAGSPRRGASGSPEAKIPHARRRRSKLISEQEG